MIKFINYQFILILAIMWSGSGFKRNMQSLVNSLVEQEVIKSKKVYNAMLAVDRGDFCADKHEAYWDM